jgi:hypothetical protein
MSFPNQVVGGSQDWGVCGHAGNRGRFLLAMKLGSLLFAEAAHVIAVVNVPGGRADQDHSSEQVWSLQRGRHSYHGAYRVADEHRALQSECTADLDHVVGIPWRVEYLALS